MSDSSSQDGPIEIVFAVDKAFLPYTSVAVCSALTNSTRPLSIHILQDGKLGRGQKRLENLVNDLGGSVTFYDVDESKLAHLPVTDHVSLATYYRLCVAELLPESVSRLLYLDGDIIVRRCLSELYSFPTDPLGIAASPEPSPRVDELGLPAGSPYFNAGVLVLDLDYFRSESITEQLFDIAKTNCDRLRFWDQDVLALYLQGQFSQLPNHWNMTHRYFFGDNRLPTPQQEPAIVHFSGAGLKPWSKGVDHPYKAEFWNWAEKVAQYGFRVKRPDRFRWFRRAA